MKIDLKGKRALIGGSSKGIGEAIGRQMAESGAAVTLMARSEEKLLRIMEELPGGDHDYLVVDFNKPEEYLKILDTYLASHKVDILVNNTQGPPAGNTLERSMGDYQQAFDLLFRIVHETTRRVLPGMQDRGWGRIINVASVSVREPLSYLALSNTIRASVVTWAKSLSRDVAPYGITVNNILTGYFDTERIAQLNEGKARDLGIKPEDVREQMEQQVPVGRIGKPEEYGYLATFLASDQAAYLTGSNIPLDGGLLRSL